MTGIEELILLLGGTLFTIGSAKLLKFVKCKICKKRLKKILEQGFKDLDFDMIKKGIQGLIDFDSKNGSKKLEKYLLPIVKMFRDDDERMNINESNLKEALRDFSKLENIFDEDKGEVEKQNKVVDEKIEMVESQFLDIKKRREEILRRKNQIRAVQRDNKRASGGMG